MPSTHLPEDLPAGLYVVATPIGNLEDITYRAVSILKRVDCIACEDTRHSQKLLSHLGIHSIPLLAYHNFNERSATPRLLEMIGSGKRVALISDAGTPSLSDPGFYLIRAAHDAGFTVIPIPGVSAAMAAISVSPLPIQSFFFLGFLPAKKGRQSALQSIAQRDESVIIYESPYRFLKLLEDCAHYFPSRRLFIGREITKTFESFRVGVAAELLEQYSKEKILGEFVVIIGPKPDSSALTADRDAENEPNDVGEPE